MLTIFTHTKAFKGHVGLIQRNAISQWSRLRPRPEIILFGNRDGTAEIAKEFGLRHIPEVTRNEFGTALLSDIFAKAHALASYDILCYANADMMFLGDFMGAVDRVASWRDRFLMVGRRTNLDLDDPAMYALPGQEVRLRAIALRWGRLGTPTAIDYFVFPRGLFPSIPPFAIGRPWWDNWVLWEALKSHAALVDASEIVLALHQNHGYVLPHGSQDVMQCDEAVRNRSLAGRGFRTIADATHKLGTDGVRYSPRHLLGGVFFRACLVTNRTVWSSWWEFLRITGPFRHPLGLRRERIANAFGRRRVL